MQVLGIETSGDLASVAVVGEEGLVAEVRFRHRLLLSRDLLPRTEQVLAMAGIETADLEGVAVSVGPGSFTGLRIGVTAAKSLAYALRIPATGVSTLEALAAETPPVPETLICAAISGSKKDLFAGMYEWVEGDLKACGEEALLTPDLLAERLAHHRAHTLLVGVPGAHAAMLRARLGDRIVLPHSEHLPAAATVATLGRRALLAGRTTDPHDLSPRYLRLSTPEERRQEALCRNS